MLPFPPSWEPFVVVVPGWGGGEAEGNRNVRWNFGESREQLEAKLGTCQPRLDGVCTFPSIRLEAVFDRDDRLFKIRQHASNRNSFVEFTTCRSTAHGMPVNKRSKAQVI